MTDRLEAIKKDHAYFLEHDAFVSPEKDNSAMGWLIEKAEEGKEAIELLSELVLALQVLADNPPYDNVLTRAADFLYSGWGPPEASDYD